MRYEKSCGAVIYYKEDGNIFYLVLKHNAGHWSFPKGHVEENETELETALREIREETGLSVIINEGFRKINKYSPSTNVIKEVIYFIAESHYLNIIPQIEEVNDAKWYKVDDAIEILTFNSDKEILYSANNYILDNISIKNI